MIIRIITKPSSKVAVARTLIDFVDVMKHLGIFLFKCCNIMCSMIFNAKNKVK